MHIGVVGGGYWGSKHVRVLSTLEAVKQVTLVEQATERREAMATAFPSIQVARDLDEVLDQLDGVVIATRSASHVELGLRAIRAGKHALIEKPLATSVADAELLCSEAALNGVVLMTGHTFVFNPVVVDLKRRILAGDLGRIRYIRSSRLNLGLYQSDVNVLWDLAPHDISIMNYLLDDHPTEVTAWAHRSATDLVEDVGVIRLTYANSDIEGFVNVSWLDPAKVRTVTVVGSEKMAVYDDVNTEERLRIFDRGITSRSTRLHDVPMSYRYGSITSPYIDFDEPLALEDTHFVEAIRSGAAERATGDEGLRVVAVLEAAQTSLVTGRSAKVMGGEPASALLSRPRLTTVDVGDSETQVPFLDLAGMHRPLRQQLDEVWHRTTDTGAFVGGAAVERFEGSWADYCGTRYAVGVANGTDSLELILRGLGIGPGDEVIVPANTFIATAEAVAACGAAAVFVDVDPATLLLTADDIRPAISPATAAVIAVHLYGQPCQMDEINELASRHQLAVIEDAAQAHGGRWNATVAGGLGTAGSFSFYPGKNLGAFGDGGAVVTNDGQLAARVRSLSNHGRPDPIHGRLPVIGRNSRLDGMQAGVLMTKLPHLEGWNRQRRRAYELYLRATAELPITMVAEHPHAYGVHHLAVAQVPQRDQVIEKMAKRDVDVRIHYPEPCHRYPMFDLGLALPVTEAASRRILSLPMFPTITDRQINRVCEALGDTLAELGELA